MKKNTLINIKVLCLILLVCICLCFVGCNTKDHITPDDPNTTDDSTDDNNNKDEDDKGDEQIDETPANVTVTSWTILKDTDYETSVYKFTTDKEGPKIAIVGGIHGDETAGWTAGLRLVDSISTMKGICGEILLIPQANILADNAKSRYKVTGYDFSDLNRSFPLDRYDTADRKSVV